MTRLLQRVQEIEGRLAEATPGPWRDGGNCIEQVNEPWADVVAQETRGSSYLQHEVLVIDEGDRQLIAHAPADLALAAKLLRIFAEAGCDKRSETGMDCVDWLKAYSGEMAKALDKYGCLRCRVTYAADEMP